MKKLIVFIFALFTIMLFVKCDGPFLAEDKSGVPSDHTSSEHGFLHKPGMENPFKYDPITGVMTCASADCHGEDLRGGIAFVENKNNFAPSCYQCHNKKWDELSDFNKLEMMK